MKHAVRISDLAAMSSHEREQILDRMTAEATASPNGQMDSARARVRTFEQRYEFSSAKLLERLKAGEQKETAEIAEWLFCLKLLAIGR